MTVSFDEFKKIHLRIAEVVEVTEHPNADKLYLVQVSLPEGEKQIVAGIRGQYSPDDLKGKKIVMVDNLEPIDIRGERSFGMLLAASADGGPVIIVPEKDVPPGTNVS